MKNVTLRGFEIEVQEKNKLENRWFSKNVGSTKVYRIEANFTSEYFPEYKILSIKSTPEVWLPVENLESVLIILKHLSNLPMLTKKALEYANRDIKDDADKLMPTNKTIAWKKRDKGDRPTCPGHPG